jgi:hypothetical protein
MLAMFLTWFESSRLQKIHEDRIRMTRRNKLIWDVMQRRQDRKDDEKGRREGERAL